MADLLFHHHFLPGDPADSRTLLLLHGTGGTEDDLLSVGRAVAPTCALLSPRGRVLENGMPRFFRRLAEGVFDHVDLAARTAELAEFVTAAAVTYHRDPGQIIALGFSNGANIAASLLLRNPGLLAGAVLIRAMVPFEPPSLPQLAGTPVLLLSATADPLVPAANTARLATLFESAGAKVTLQWQPGGHGLVQQDLDAAKSWMSQLPSPL